jgi:hypothetical protein
MVSCSLVGAGVGLPYKEGDYFGNILMPNDTFLILVKIQPIKGTILGLVTYCTIGYNLIVQLGFSNSGQVLNFCMWNYVQDGEAKSRIGGKSGFKYRPKFRS